jgi:hypothetical protein
MQALRKSLIAGSVLALALSAGAFAAPLNDDSAQTRRSREVRKAEKPPSPWIGTIITVLDALDNWLSIPPG